MESEHQGNVEEVEEAMESEHQPKLSPMRAFQALMHGRQNPSKQVGEIVDDHTEDGIIPASKSLPKAFLLHGIEDDAYTSLSEYHDYEPCLEFDDSELVQQSTGLAPLPPELLNLNEELLERPASDGTIEENFEEELAKAPEVYTEISGSLDEESFSDLTGTGLVEVVGDDEVGRRIIVVSACRLPPNKELHQDKLLRYLIFTLDKYVEQDYSLVYFHHGLSSKNKPAITWLWKAYKAFDRKYKKNLKALYLVHPTNFIRIVWQMLKPAISVKFGRKMMYVNYLHELQQHLNLEKLCIPEQVLENDKMLLSKNPRAAEIARVSAEKIDKVVAPEVDATRKELSPPPTQQFGVSLQFIKEKNPDMIGSIPPLVRQCVEFLSQPDALETEGIFRRSANKSVIMELQRACNRGEPISFRDDPHIAAVLLKTFLKDLEEPLMTFDLYEEILQFQTWTNKAKPRQVKILILERLPLDNYKLLKYIIQFLWKVQDRSCLNKMTSSNLAVVFGPNLAWPPNGQMSLQAIAPINAFTDFLLENQESIFII
ncbi:rho GTPase-activating protein 1 isoform X1 [Hyposmocoma kahamanoa]|uniref:rho GTPase-activating protein 1 isoform X1 n=1 Tax=Hyposmocoma kahamanoa TaxID=1477025 RepID=UPI000E6DA14C|nr:rho GTPase-activating protein 1 isoform X1 [Hyposmocoma kahamanoa]XP_026332996.1 rho GTPase-activating protein 1 isoform X1 [Hyposmocoma kahamanoa]